MRAVEDAGPYKTPFKAFPLGGKVAERSEAG